MILAQQDERNFICFLEVARTKSDLFYMSNANAELLGSSHSAHPIQHLSGALGIV